MVSTDAGATFTLQVDPSGKFAFSHERDLDAGQIFFRHKLNTELEFAVKADFTYFHSIEKDYSRRCEEIFIRREWLCNGSWRPYWTGVFSTGSGSFDLERCIFRVKPEVYDRYTCLLTKVDDRVNVMDTPVVDVSAIILPSFYEFALCEVSGGATFNCTMVVDGDQVPIEYDGHANPAYGWYMVEDLTGCADGPSQVWWRERTVTTCLAGDPVPPPGNGWNLLEDNCAVDGTAVYVRIPTIAFPFGSAVVVVDSSEDPTPPSDSCTEWIYAGTNSCDFFAGTFRHVYYCVGEPGAGTTWNTGRLFSDVMNKVVSASSDCGLSVVSDFFEIDPPGDAPGYSTGVNYVTGGTNKWSNLVMLQKSDALDPTATDPATLGEITFKELIALLASMRIFWDIDANGHVRFEHWIYWTFPLGLDVAAIPTAVDPKAYKHLSGEIPRIERPQWMEAQGNDFVRGDIIYSGPCVNSTDADSVKTYSFGKFTTDLSYISNDPSAISKDGFVLLATTNNGVGYDVIVGPGVLTGQLITNSPMATSVLEDAFWRYDRLLPNGVMNDVQTAFAGYLPNIEQDTVTIVNLCCKVPDLDPKKRVKTRLGVALGGIPGYIEKVSFEEKGEILDLTIRYPY